MSKEPNIVFTLVQNVAITLLPMLGVMSFAKMMERRDKENKEKAKQR